MLEGESKSDAGSCNGYYVISPAVRDRDHLWARESWYK